MNEQQRILEKLTKIDLYCPLAGRNCDRLSNRISFLQQKSKDRERDLT